MAAALELPLSLCALSSRIQRGEVVFFVGAGFSLDSEGLSAERLMRRLLLRLVALDQLQPEDEKGRAFKQLAGMFQVPESMAKIAVNPSEIQKLAFRYYEVNEWMCRTYGKLIQSGLASSHKDFAAELLRAEQKIVVEVITACQLQDAKTHPAKTSPVKKRPKGKTPRDNLAGKWTQEHFDPVPESWWDPDSRNLAVHDPDGMGKLVFVQTLGFLDPKIMAGAVLSPKKRWSLHEMERAFAGRLKARHHVLARLAREGFCPTLLTTNFDLLLEGAMRLTGFEYGALESEAAKAPELKDNLTSIPWFDVIGSPQAFFRRGKAYRAATVLKIHGCAGRLRELDIPKGIRGQVEYLKQVVYTYREIQNWRDDSWAADHLRTLLRTRTMVFAGYSTADPVLHDTFRGIYEEMARKAVGTDGANGATSCQEDAAPAYFLAYSPDDCCQEFHGNEVLRSASRAVGGKSIDSTIKDHPNYLRFAPSWKHDSSNLKLDEMLSWVQHEILRNQQRAALKTELSHLIARLDRRRPASECGRIIAGFDQLVLEEVKSIKGAGCPSKSRLVLKRALAWSQGFHHALRREWARGLLLGSSPGKFAVVADLDCPTWYYPASERPEWTAWSAVVELALRQLGRLALKVWCGAGKPEKGVEINDLDPVQATHAQRPSIFIQRHPGPAAPVMSLTLQLRGFDRPGQSPRLPGNPSRKVIWMHADDATPWRTGTAPAQEGCRYGKDYWRPQPCAADLWHLALNTPGTETAEQIVCRLLMNWPNPLAFHDS
ncbi:MAG TPA: SIR2 family protein [Candidatus Limnocylindria bacterium]|jgi:hypothetical protein|nr:SIR2 family protein [Candidatus Limnocylindria bacterium]